LAALTPGPPVARAPPAPVAKGCYRGPGAVRCGTTGGRSNDPRFSRAHAEIACETVSRPAHADHVRLHL